MSKYAPLAEYLKRQNREYIPMTFSEIERVTGVRLPASAVKHRPWWSNNRKNSVMTSVWLDAGFKSEQVDMVARRLVFHRVGMAKAGGSSPVLRSPSHAHEKKFHPLYGALKGLMRVVPGTDLTAPADPDWGRVYDGTK